MPAAAADPRAPLYVVAAATLWGTTGTAQALGPDGASSVAVGATRNVVGALVLVGGGRRSRAGCSRACATSSAGRWCWPPLATAAYQLCFFGGVRLAGVAIGTVVGVGSGPVWGGLVGWIGRGERPGRRWALATALALSGAALLATTHHRRRDRSTRSASCSRSAPASRYAALHAVVEGAHRPATTPTA